MARESWQPILRLAQNADQSGAGIRHWRQSAWAAARTKNTYVAVQFRRLAAKRGRKRAIVAIGHSLLITGYHLLRKQRMYQDLGPGYLDRINAEGLKRYLVKRLESLGQKVTLEPRESAA
jgi:transposase